MNEAQEQFPLKDIGAKVKKVYQNSNVIRTRQIEITRVDAAITSHNISENSEVQIMHSYGHSLIVALMEKIEAEWEAENSVYAKLKSNKESMREYFIMVSQGVEKTMDLWCLPPTWQTP